MIAKQLPAMLKLATENLIEGFKANQLEPDDVVIVGDVIAVGFNKVNTNHLFYRLGPIASVILNPEETYQDVWDKTQRVFGIIASEHDYPDKILDNYLTAYSVVDNKFYLYVEFVGGFNNVECNMVSNFLNDLLNAVTNRDVTIVKKRLS